MDDLILTIRLNVLKNNLQQIERLLLSIKDRRAEIQNLLDILDQDQGVRDPLYQIERSIDSTIAKLKRLSDGKNDEVAELIGSEDGEGLQRAKKELERLREQLGKANDVVDAIRKRLVPLGEKTPVERMLTSVLMTKARNLVEHLDTVSHDLRSTERDNTDALPALRKTVWMSHIKAKYEEMQALFGEYVDFLGGMALREAGIDEGICQVADELITGCDWNRPRSTPPWESLTILSSQEAISMTLAQIIRMGFPEWTYWALPLTAHAFGHVHISWNSYLSDLLKRHPAGDQEKLKILLADAFATYVMGPAYAYALVLLRLNPVMPFQDQKNHPAHAKRAFTVFEMLEMMERKSKGTSSSPFADARKLLSANWDETVSQVNSGRRASKQNAQQKKTSLNEKVIKACINGLWKHFEKNAMMRYDPRYLNVTKRALSLILDGAARKDVEADLRGTEELRDVLNAAWIYRVEEKADAEKISSAAGELWQMITKVKTEAIKRATEARTKVPGR